MPVQVSMTNLGKSSWKYGFFDNFLKGFGKIKGYSPMSKFTQYGKIDQQIQPDTRYRFGITMQVLEEDNFYVYHNKSEFE